MIGIIKNTPFRIKNFTDLISYELTGKDTIDFYYGSVLRNIVKFFKKI